MKPLFFAIGLALIAACSSNENERFVVDIGLGIAVKDSTGNDLLDPKNQNSFKDGEIKLFYLKDGKAVEFYKSHFDSPRGYTFREHQHGYRIGVMLNSDKNEAFPVTLIQWNSSDTDTIKCSIKRTSSSEVCDKVWLNNELVWEAYETARYIEIIK